MVDADVIVVGAGPVGMLAALLSAQNGFTVLLLEQSSERALQSRAIGITPPSLEILESLGLAGSFIEHGVAVRVAEAHGQRQRLGSLDFTGLPGGYPFVLSIPQEKTETLLEQAVLAQGSIRFLRGHRVTGCSEEGDRVVVSGKRSEAETFNFAGRYFLACDGGKSAVRESLGIPFEGAPERHTFLMGDYEDNTGWGEKALFFFTARGSVESFPLPGGKRRFVLPTPRFIEAYTTDYLAGEILRRAGIDLSGVRQFWESGFGVRSFMAQSFCQGRVFLCGDAAHLMSPVGGQNMNTGFADAELAAWLCAVLLENRAPKHLVRRLYHGTRKKAAGVAQRRGPRPDEAGGAGGHIWSAIRNMASLLILHTPFRPYLARLFSMQSIPGRNLRVSRASLAKELKLR
jgi:2-polyprenyl-6-methoxyphenol hydroxylase-like FAD-dependent oxidoreductase